MNASDTATMTSRDVLRSTGAEGRSIETAMSASRTAITSDSGTGLRGAIVPASQIR